MTGSRVLTSWDDDLLSPYRDRDRDHAWTTMPFSLSLLTLAVRRLTPLPAFHHHLHDGYGCGSCPGCDDCGLCPGFRLSRRSPHRCRSRCRSRCHSCRRGCVSSSFCDFWTRPGFLTRSGRSGRSGRSERCRMRRRVAGGSTWWMLCANGRSRRT